MLMTREGIPVGNPHLAPGVRQCDLERGYRWRTDGAAGVEAFDVAPIEALVWLDCLPRRDAGTLPLTAEGMAEAHREIDGDE